MSNLGVVAEEQEIEQLTGLFQLLADRTRLSIVLSLLEGERNVTSLCHDLQLPQPTVSHHLGLLRGGQIIVNRRRGKQVFYTLNSAMSQADGSSLELNIDNYALRILRKSG